MREQVFVRIQKLTIKEIGQIYKKQMQNDFPVSEIKPLERINSLFQRGLYEGYGLFWEKEIIGYAFLTTAKDSEWKLLDYFAVCSKYRSNGYGSKFLTMLKEGLKKENAKALLIEIESIESSTSKCEEQIRKRRRKFYMNNEMIAINECATIFDMEYEILYYSFGGRYETDQIIRKYAKIYQSTLPGKLYEKNCFI